MEDKHRMCRAFLDNPKINLEKNTGLRWGWDHLTGM